MNLGLHIIVLNVYTDGTFDQVLRSSTAALATPGLDIAWYAKLNLAQFSTVADTVAELEELRFSQSANQ